MASAGCNGDVLRVVLLGKAGAGKSSLGNSLTGHKPSETAWGQQGFNVGRGLKSRTVYCDWRKGNPRHDGTIIEVMDTPGLCDTHLDEREIYREVAKSVADPGPHVIIFTVRCDRRFTEEQYKAFKKIQELFSEEMNKHLILVFNGMDCFIEDDGETTLEEQRQYLAQEIRTFGEQLNDMIQKAGNRFFGMNNKATGQEKDRQINDLVHMMKEMVKTNGQDCIFKCPVTEQIMEKVEKMAEEEARAKTRDDLKAKIIREEVEPRFLQSMTDSVVSGASKVVRAVSDMFSGM